MRLAIITLALAATSAVTSANLLVNTGFETGNLAPWFMNREFNSVGIGQVWQTTTTEAHSGTFSAFCESNKELRQNVTPTLGSMVQSFAFWAKVPDQGGIFGVWVYYSDATEDFVVNSPGTTNWAFYNMLSMVNTSKTVIGFGVNGYMGGGAAPDLLYVDDFRAESVPEPATMAALGLGAAALLRRRRR